MIRTILLFITFVGILTGISTSTCHICDDFYRPEEDRYFSKGVYDWEIKLSGEERMKSISGNFFPCGACLDNTDYLESSRHCGHLAAPGFAEIFFVVYCEYSELTNKSPMPFNYSSGVEFYHYPNLERLLNIVRKIGGYEVIKLALPVVGKLLKEKGGLDHTSSTTVFHTDYDYEPRLYDLRLSTFGNNENYRYYNSYPGHKKSRIKAILGTRYLKDYASYSLISYDYQKCLNLISGCVTDNQCYSLVLGGDAYNVDF